MTIATFPHPNVSSSPDASTVADLDNVARSFGAVRAVSELTLRLQRGCQALLGAVAGRFRASHIDLRRAFRAVRQHDHAIGQNFHKSAHRRAGKHAASGVVSEFADPHLGQQRRVPRQHANIPAKHRDLRLAHRFANDLRVPV